jgi:hypothetical protein
MKKGTSISIEILTEELILDITRIMKKNYSETKHFDIPLDIDWDFYLSLRKAFKAFIMRNMDDTIVGILFFITANYPHIKTLTMAQQVTFYVEPKYRRYSLEMISCSESYFTQVGINLIIQSARYKTGFCKVLEEKGYEPSDIAFIKRIR